MCGVFRSYTNFQVTALVAIQTAKTVPFSRAFLQKRQVTTSRGEPDGSRAEEDERHTHADKSEKCGSGNYKFVRGFTRA